MGAFWRRWRAALVTFALLIAAAGPIPSTTTLRLEYQRSGEWKLTLVGDTFSPSQVGEVYECHDGTYTRFDARGDLTARYVDPAMCISPMRWIVYGYAAYCPWRRSVDAGRATCTDGRERVVFDVSDGLPLLYQVSSPEGVVDQQTIFRLKRYGPP